MNNHRRTFCSALVAGLFAAGTTAPAFAADRIIKVGTLKLIHGITPYFYD